LEFADGKRPTVRFLRHGLLVQYRCTISLP
jgi:hypothetical protein